MWPTRSYALVLALLLALTASPSGCGEERAGRFAPPRFADGGLLRAARPLPDGSAAALAGVYRVSSGGDRLGAEVIVETSPGAVSVFAARNAAYAVLGAGCLDGASGLVLEGYFRYATSPDAGLVRLLVEPPAAGAALCAGEPPGEFSLRGALGEDDALGEVAALQRERPLRDRGGRFRVVAHRGGCRSSDDCGASENSVEVVRLAQRLGAEAIEVDVRLTADGVPVLFHDEELTPRLASGTYCHGPVASFTLAHLRALCTLVGGEGIPTLDEALSTALEETTLSGVWLDIKSPAAVAPAAEAAARVDALAEARGRAMHVTLGLGEDALVDAFSSLPEPRPRCLVETGLAQAVAAGCEVWSPRWTLGPMADQVATAQASGLRVAFWTLDDPVFIESFLEETRPNALLTNRPGLVAHLFELRGTVPAGPPGAR
jgi:glycerophosphoryl diester phosphodiesterase